LFYPPGFFTDVRIEARYYGVATGTILFYDYFLTLADEIEYIWRRKKSWIFWLFIINRYFPMTWQFWQFDVAYGPQTQHDITACERTTWLPLVVFATCTLIAQVVLTTRIYAITMKNIPIVTGFAVITASQVVLAICIITLTAGQEVQPLSSLPLDAYHLCTFYQHRSLDIAYTSISLLFDLLAFSLVVFLAKRSRAARVDIWTILDKIAEDSTWYFVVIFTSQLVLVLTLGFARPIIQLLPVPGIIVYIPVMISRIILSLRKTAASPRDDESLAEPTTISRGVQTSLPPQNTPCREDGIPLDELNEP